MIYLLQHTGGSNVHGCLQRDLFISGSSRVKQTDFYSILPLILPRLVNKLKSILPSVCNMEAPWLKHIPGAEGKRSQKNVFVMLSLMFGI